MTPASIFDCAGCHVGGGNVVQAGATLRAGDLQRNGVASAEAIYDLVYSGRGKMPGYGTGCTPKVLKYWQDRLSPDAEALPYMSAAELCI